MNYGYFLKRPDHSDVNQKKQQLLENGADCFLFDEDNLDSHFPKWLTLIDFLNEGDKLIVSELNDIFLDIHDLLKLYNEFKQKGIQFLSIKENFGFNQGNHYFFNGVTVYEDYYKNFLGTMTKKKIALSKNNKQPRKKSRKMSEQALPKAIEIAKKYLDDVPVNEILDEFGFCYRTFKRYLESIGINPNKARFGNLPGFEDDELIIKNIVDLYEKYRSIPKIAKHYPKLKSFKIRKILVSQGIGIGGKGNKKS